MAVSSNSVRAKVTLQRSMYKKLQQIATERDTSVSKLIKHYVKIGVQSEYPNDADDC